MRRLLISACVLGLTAFFAPASQAALVAYDGFEYPVDSALAGQGGGIGWGTNLWTLTSGGNGTVAAGSLSYSDGTSSLVTSGNHIVRNVAGHNRRILGSDFMLDAANPELWVTFIVQAASTASGHVGIALFSTPTTEIVTIGKGASATNWGLAGIGEASVETSTAATTRALLAVQFLHGTGNATANIWVNPSLDLASIGSPDATTTLPNFTLHQVRLSTAGGTNQVGSVFDELRIGTTFDSVIPEPASVGLLGLAGLAMLRRRRH